MKLFRNVLIGALIGFSGIVLAATFTKFQPATGVLVGNSSTYVTTAANSSDLLTVIGTVPVANGGTNLTAASDDATMVGNGTTWQSKALPNCGSSTQALAYATASNSFSCQTITGSGTSPGGSNTQIQFNDSSAFGGDADLTWDKTLNTATFGGSATAGILQGGSALGLTVKGGANGAGAGTQLTLNGGSGTSSGGSVTVQGGTASAGSGGPVAILGGVESGTNAPGDIRLDLRSNSANVGAILIRNSNSSESFLTISRNPATSSYTETTLIGGNIPGTSNGLALTVQAGPASNTSSTAGVTTLAGGDSTAGGAGNAGANLALRGGNASGSGNNNGGSITLTAGTKTASGVAGRINLAGGFASTGTKFTASGCSNSTTVGGTQAGQYTSGTTGTCTVTITLPAAPNGWACYASDMTTPLVQAQTASTATSCTLSGTTSSGDVITFGAIGF